MEKRELDRFRRIKEKLDELGVSAITSDDIEWLVKMLWEASVDEILNYKKEVKG